MSDVDTLSSFVSSGGVSLQCFGRCTIHDSSSSWQQYYPVLSFLLNGHLHVDYVRLSGWLGIPPCSSTQWHRILQKLEIHITKLAEWSCGQACLWSYRLHNYSPYMHMYCPDEEKWGQSPCWQKTWDGGVYYIIIHRTCTCIVHMKKNGDSHLAGKKLGMEDLYLHTLGIRLEG